MNTPNPDDLSASLRLWRAEPHVPASFQREVWQRIAARQVERDKATLPGLLQWFFSQIARPQYATALVIMSLSASIGLAHVKAQGTNARDWKLLEARYVSSVDPLAMPR